MKRILVLLLALVLVLPISAQNKPAKKQLNWYNKDLTSDKQFGVSTEKAYKELLKGRQATEIIVAVIDGGTDINHEDLKGVIWTNQGEIPGNGIDDDKNGYIDDIHGWNFIGNAKGENVQYDNLEATRIYREYKDFFEKGGNEDDPAYSMYMDARKYYEEELQETKKMLTAISKSLMDRLGKADSLVKAQTRKTNYTLKDLNKVKAETSELQKAIGELKMWMERGAGYDDLKSYYDHYRTKADYHLNVNFDPRNIIGDDWQDNSDRFYGNNDVAGPDAGHGTFVAGCIAAVRNNKKGADGVASNVKLMILRVVPDGDERDKDVANAIRYAVDNGARIINMSFGKSFSPQKQFVDEVLPMAAERNVLLVHAAGNDGENNDEVTNYPENRDASGNAIITSWLTVGASSMYAGEDLAAGFSNYGKKNVDVFGPGVDIWGLEPGNAYGSGSGTSMAAPVVTGVAAVVLGAYPGLSAAQLKEIIVKSALPYDGKVNCPDKKGKKKQIAFSELSVSGGVANLYRALQMAEQMSSGK